MRHVALLYVLAAFSVFLNASDAKGNGDRDSVVITEQTESRAQKFSQFELDVASRKQALEDEKVLDPEGKLNLCCVLLSRDAEMLFKVITHFKKKFGDLDDYGMIVQENEDYYLIHFWERYRLETQKQIHGYWKPSISGDVKEYRYLVDRKTFEILGVSE